MGDVALATGLTARAIRYYEELGLLRPADRRSGANRRFDQDDVDRLVLIKRLREDIGLGLAEIEAYLEAEDLRQALRSEYQATADPAVQLAVLERAEPIVRRRIALLEHKRQLIEALRAEDEARLQRIAALRRELATPRADRLLQETHG